MAKCDCLEKVQEALKPKNCKLQTVLTMNFTTGRGSIVGPLLAVEKLDKSRDRLPTVFPTYCPFCGVKVDDEPKPQRAKKARKKNAK